MQAYCNIYVPVWRSRSRHLRITSLCNGTFDRKMPLDRKHKAQKNACFGMWNRTLYHSNILFDMMAAVNSASPVKNKAQAHARSL